MSKEGIAGQRSGYFSCRSASSRFILLIRSCYAAISCCEKMRLLMALGALGSVVRQTSSREKSQSISSFVAMPSVSGHVTSYSM